MLTFLRLSQPPWKSGARRGGEFWLTVTSLRVKWKTCVPLKFSGIKNTTKQNHIVPARPLRSLIFQKPSPLFPLAGNQETIFPCLSPASSGTLGTECVERRLNLRWLLQIWWRMGGAVGGGCINWRRVCFPCTGRIGIQVSPSGLVRRITSDLEKEHLSLPGADSGGASLLMMACS